MLYSRGVPDDTYSINDLSRLTGLSVRTIRYYLAQGLIPASGESGPGAHYGQGHLDRLRLIKRLQSQYLPNAEIRRRLAPLSDADVASLVVDPEDESTATPTSSALDYIRNLFGTASATYSASSAPSMPQASAALPTSPSLLGRGLMAPQRSDATATPADAGKALEEQSPFLRPMVLGIAKAAEQSPIEPKESSPQPERSQWERLQLAENIELHIRRPLSRIEQRRVERLITIARQVLTEDQS